MHITSPAFSQNTSIPASYTCDGADSIPPLEWAEVPEEAKSLALLVDDPDSPRGSWVHWIVWNIPPGTRAVSEGALPAGISGTNDFGRTGWGGPCPHTGSHRYVFTLWALDTVVDLSPEEKNGQETKRALREAINGHILAEAQLIGIYERKK